MDCFISYATADLKTARSLRDALISRGISVFLAEDSTPPGTAWPAIISGAVRRSDIVLLLDSQHSRASAWVQQEAGIALASGSLVLAVSLDGRVEGLPGWLSGIQAIKPRSETSIDECLADVVQEVCTRLGSSWGTLPQELQVPRTVAGAVLRTVLLDQYSGPEERLGAWSRQYDRYLRIYYGDGAIRTGVSQGASLTLTGMVIERLSALASSSDHALARLAVAALRLAETFVLSCQDPVQGGFGRLTSDFRVRSGRNLQLDLRHTCWAIRALLCIDGHRHSDRIDAGLEWLATRARHREDSDRWCWSAAPLLALAKDTRLLRNESWQKHCAVLEPLARADLEASFDPRWTSWVKGEPQEKQALVSIDDALYVLYCLKDSDSLSEVLLRQRREAIQGLLGRTRVLLERGASIRGLALFATDRPDPGPTVQLLEVMSDLEGTVEYGELAGFVVTRLAERSMMDQTFSWHLSAALAVSRLRDQTTIMDC